MGTVLLAFSAISASSAFLRGRAFHLGCGGMKGSRAGQSLDITVGRRSKRAGPTLH